MTLKRGKGGKLLRVVKDGKSDDGAMNESFIHVQVSQLSGKRLKEVEARRLKAAAKVVGIKEVTFHILRHSYASVLAMEGCPMGVIGHALGHADTRMTERHYAHLAPSYVAETIRKHLPDFGIKPDKKVTKLRR